MSYRVSGLSIKPQEWENFSENEPFQKRERFFLPKIKARHRVCNYQAFKILRRFSLQRSHLYVFEEEPYRRRINHKDLFLLRGDYTEAKIVVKSYFCRVVAK